MTFKLNNDNKVQKNMTVKTTAERQKSGFARWGMPMLVLAFVGLATLVAVPLWKAYAGCNTPYGEEYELEIKQLDHPSTICLGCPAPVTIMAGASRSISGTYSYNWDITKDGTSLASGVTQYESQASADLAFTELGKKTMTLKVSNSSHDHLSSTGPYCMATQSFDITVVRVDLDVDSDYNHTINDADEALEESFGGRLPLNDDDDNGNQIEDRFDPTGDTGEDDLVPINLKVEPSLSEGTTTLSVYYDPPDSNVCRVVVWNEASKQTKSTCSWPGTSVPSTLWVEGVSNSLANRDIVLVLSYSATGSESDACADTNRLTVIQLDLDVDSDHTTDFGGPEETLDEDALEMQSPGLPNNEAHKYVVVNNYHEHESDTNAIPGYADGYDLDTALDADNVMSRSIVPPERPYRPADNEIFVPAKLKVRPTDLPVDWTQVMIKFNYSVLMPGEVTWDGDPTNRVYRLYPSDPSDCGRLRLWTEQQSTTRSKASVAIDGDFVPAEEDIPADKLQLPEGAGTNLFLEGITNGLPGWGEDRIDVEETGIPLSIDIKLKDWMHCTVITVDVDVDSDNNNGFAAPDRNNAEDQYEDVTNRPGKVICVNDGDKDGDGIPDYADGYDLLTGVAEDNANASEQFVPIVFELPAPIDLSRARVRLTYDASDPALVTSPTNGVYELPSTGSLRIWKRIGGDQTRDKNVIPSGDYVAPGEYSADEFGFSSSTRTLTYYLEAVTNSAALADRRILFEVRPDERTGFMAADAVRVTALKVVCISVVPKGTPDGYELPIPPKLAAGGLNSASHQADVTIQVVPALPHIPVPIWIEGGKGHEQGKDAKLEIGSATAVGCGGVILVCPDSDGKLQGILTSSDVFDLDPENACRIHALNAHAHVVFNWDDCEDEELYTDTDQSGDYTPGDAFVDQDGNGSWTSEQWRLVPDVLETPSVITNMVRLRHHRGATYDSNWQPLVGHKIRMFVSEVEYMDGNGVYHTLANTPDAPVDLSEWAEFPSSPATTDQNGEASIILTIKDKPELQSLTITCNDFTVYDSPSSGN